MGNGTPLGRVRGLGSSHGGVHHWLAERLTGLLAFAPVVWLLVSFVLLPDFTWKTVHDWIVQPIPALSVALLLIASFWHNRVGMRVFIEDYVHTGPNRLMALLALDFFTYAGAAIGLLFIVLMVMGGLSGEVAKGVVQTALQSTMGAR